MTRTLSRGLLLAFEGIDGSGKSTQARLFADWVKEQGYEVVRTREPTDGPWGRMIREARFSHRLTPQEEMEAFLADRREHVESLIAPALASHAVVVVDRYYYSSAAYQGARGLDPRTIVRLNREFAPRPTAVFLFDVEPTTAISRIRERGQGQDLFETHDALTRVRDIFVSLSKTEAHFVVIDGSRPELQVFDALRDQVRILKLLPE